MKCSETIVHFPLKRSDLCLDCDAVFELAGVCPACGSETVASLARFLEWAPEKRERV